MASPQLENGFLQIANELYEAINRSHYSRVQLKIIHCVLRETYGRNKKKYSKISVAKISKIIDESPSAISYSLKKLIDLNVINVIQNYSVNHSARVIGINKNYESWIEPDANKKGFGRSKNEVNKIIYLPDNYQNNSNSSQNSSFINYQNNVDSNYQINVNSCQNNENSNYQNNVKHVNKDLNKRILNKSLNSNPALQDLAQKLNQYSVEHNSKSLIISFYKKLINLTGTQIPERNLQTEISNADLLIRLALNKINADKYQRRDKNFLKSILQKCELLFDQIFNSIPKYSLHMISIDTILELVNNELIDFNHKKDINYLDEKNTTSISEIIKDWIRKLKKEGDANLVSMKEKYSKQKYSNVV